ncbi:unnamed protein product [Nesidiocoris tenuis]|uniref:Secreted protein n=1 Tax=Nesidiocoris tenuis TaxID=355587 RepID=A0A6H5HBY3_9HEMI|nr:unnamed protein product [Nesidiocoris tenuis]
MKASQALTMVLRRVVFCFALHLHRNSTLDEYSPMLRTLGSVLVYEARQPPIGSCTYSRSQNTLARPWEEHRNEPGASG